MACWQWNNFLEAQAPAGRRIVRINMDETHVKLYFPLRKGAIAPLPCDTFKLWRVGETKASLSLRRSGVTFVAFVCDDHEVQQRLPQIVIGGETVLPRRVLNELNEEDLDNIFFLRQKKSWVNAKVMVSIIDLLAATLKEYQETHCFILSMDTCPSHVPSEVPAACSRVGIRPLYVPASMTGDMQPCDVAVFGIFKRFIRDRLEDLRVESSDGEVSTKDFMLSIVAGIHKVLMKRSWCSTFQHCGLRDRQKRLAKGFLRKLRWGDVPNVSADLPTLHQLEMVYPRGANIPILELFKWYFPNKTASTKRVRMQSACEALPCPSAPWFGRLRSSSALQMQDSATHDSCSDADTSFPVLELPPPTESQQPWPPSTTSLSASTRHEVPRARRWLPRRRLAPAAVPPPAPAATHP